MRINRTKVVRKCLKFFRIIYNIQDPYDIILDFNFIVDCFKYKIDIHDRIIKLLQCKAIHLYILKSSYTQLTQLPHHQEEYLNFVSTLCTILEDSHLGGEEGSWRIIAFQRLIQNEYMESSVKNKCKRYMVATQDADIRNELRKIPGVPILYSNKVTLVLETPSDASKNFNMKVIEAHKNQLNDNEAQVVEKAKVVVASKALKASVTSTIASTTASEFERRKRKAQGVNPLASKTPDETSNKSKKRKVEMFKRRS